MTVNTNTAEALRTLCIVNFGHEHPTTIKVFSLLAEGYEILATEAFAQGFLDEVNERQDEEDFSDDIDESGFDPYEGCYTFDC